MNFARLIVPFVLGWLLGLLSCRYCGRAARRVGAVVSAVASGLRQRGLPPEVFEPIGRHFGIAHCVLNILVAEIVLQ